MTRTSVRAARGLAILSLLAVAGCGGSGSGGGEKTGRISIAVSDGPVHEASKVCVAFSEIELKGDGPSITVEPDVAGVDIINLLDFQGNNAAPLLSNYTIPAGEYQWVRLGVNANRMGNGGTGDAGDDCVGDESYIVTPDGTYNLWIPSGAQSGLKLHGGFTMPVNGSLNFTAEFDLMKSVTAPPGQDPDMIMRPTIRLVNNAFVGTLTGQVDESLVAPEGCAPSVYVFNDGVVPNGIEDGVVDENDPVATAMVNSMVNDMEMTEYHYTVGFLLAGNYEVAFTCDNLNFTPLNGYPAEITAGGLATVNFPASE